MQYNKLEPDSGATTYVSTGLVRTAAAMGREPTTKATLNKGPTMEEEHQEDSITITVNQTNFTAINIQPTPKMK